MRFFVLVNDALGLKPLQSTTLLAHTAVEHGHECFVVGVTELSLDPQGQILANARQVLGHIEGAMALPAALMRQAPSRLALECGDVLLIRTNPARDQVRRWAHEAALGFAHLAKSQGVCVLNDPDGLSRASSKLYAARFAAELQPETLISRDHAQIRQFIEDQPGPCVLKPLQGTHGNDVFKVHAQSPVNIKALLGMLTRQGWVMAQGYLPEAVEGDIRLLLLDGQLLEVEGHVAAVQRVPAKGEFRSNIHAGGTAQQAVVTPALRRAVRLVGPQLQRDGIFLAGLDMIGGRMVEINTFSPGGFGDASAFSGGVSFCGRVIETAARRALLFAQQREE